MRGKVAIEDDVRAVLDSATDEGDTLKLGGQLDRGTYERTAKVLAALGGKWNRSRGLHVFPKPVALVLAEGLEQGHVVDQKKAREQFFTPMGIARDMASVLSLGVGKKVLRVLEPSAGDGRLIDAALEAGKVWVQPVESDDALACDLDLKYADRHVVETTVRCDFMNWVSSIPMFDRVMMNPPFANEAALQHAVHAYEHFLVPGGLLVAIVPPGWESSRTKHGKAFRDLHDEVAVRAEALPAGTFREAGTDVRTMMVVWKKPMRFA